MKDKNKCRRWAVVYILLALLLAAVLIVGQLLVTWAIGKRMRRESLIDRIRNE